MPYSERLKERYQPGWTRRQFLYRSGGALAGLALAPHILAACATEPGAPPVDPDLEPFDTELTGTLGLLIGSHMDPIKQLVDRYNERFGVSPDVEEVTTPDLASKVRTTFLAQASPWDSVFVTASLGAELFERGWVEDLTAFIDETVRPGGELMEGGLRSVQSDGRVFSVPWTMGSQLLHWNKRMMEDVGLDPEAPAAWHTTPNSWDTFVEYAIEMTGERDGVQYWGLTDAWAGNHILWTWGGVLQMHGGRFLDEEFQPVFNDDAGVAATEKLFDLLHTHRVMDPAVTTYTWAFDASPGFFEGTRGMWITWPFIAGLAANPEASQIAGFSGVAPNPAVDTSGSVDGSEFFSIPVFAENKGEALRFLELMTSKEGQRVIANGGWASIYGDVLEEEEIVEAFPFYPALRQAYEYPVDGGYSPDREVWTVILADEIHEVLAQRKPPQEALDDAVREIEAVRQS